MVVVATADALRALHVVRSARRYSLGRAASCTMELEGDDAAIYAFGTNIGRQLGELKVFSPRELDLIFDGAKDLILQNEPQCDPSIHLANGLALFQSKNEQAQEKTAEAGDAALEIAAAKSGATRTESGLVIEQLKEGTGASPTAEDRVKVNYEGTLLDGTVFDSSYKRGEPLEFALNAVIPGWIEGLQLMKEGGKAKLTIPSDLAYGDSGTGPIPPKAVLTFEIELLAVNP